MQTGKISVALFCLLLVGGCSDDVSRSDRSATDGEESSDGRLDGRSGGAFDGAADDVAPQNDADNDADTTTDAAEQTNCPAVADSCPAACREILGRRYDAQHDCLEDPRVVGCTSDTWGTGAIACVHQKGSDDFYLIPSSSTAWNTSWVECDAETTATVNYAGPCE